MVEFDPAWEYYTPDPEIDYCVHSRGGRSGSFDAVWDRRLAKVDNLGFRFGSGNPDRDPERFRERRERRIDQPTWNEWRECERCRQWFRADSDHRRYCGNECRLARLHEGNRRPRRSQLCRCGRFFEPKREGTIYCSPACQIEGQRKPLLAEAGRCETCGAGLLPSRSRNQATARRFCSRQCKHAATCRKARARARG